MLRKMRRLRSKKVIAALALLIIMLLCTGCNSNEDVQTEKGTNQNYKAAEVNNFANEDVQSNLTDNDTVQAQPAESETAVVYSASNDYTGIPKLDQEDIYTYLSGTWYKAGDMTETMTFAQTPDQTYSYIFSQRDNGDINIETYFEGNREASFKILYNGDGKYANSYEILCAYKPSAATMAEIKDDNMEETVWVRSENSMRYSALYESRLLEPEPVHAGGDAGVNTEATQGGIEKNEEEITTQSGIDAATEPAILQNSSQVN